MSWYETCAICRIFDDSRIRTPDVREMQDQGYEDGDSDGHRHGGSMSLGSRE